MMDTGSLKRVSAVLITKEVLYPQEVLKHVEAAGFGEVIVRTGCDGVYHRFAQKPVFPDVYVQDDDCLPQIDVIFNGYDGNLITCGMTSRHLKIYSKSRFCLIGHGAFFPAKLIDSLEIYRKTFGEDDDFRIEIDRIFTFLNYPQVRIQTEPVQLESSFSPGRLSMRKDHYFNLDMLERKLYRFYCFGLRDQNRITGFFTYIIFLLRKKLKI